MRRSSPVQDPVKPSPDEKSPEPPSAPAKRLAGEVIAGRIISVLLTLLVAAAAGWLLTPGSYPQRMPQDDALGTPAVGTIRASRDYEILDTEATRRRQSDVEASQRPVYDYDDTSSEEAAARIRGAFQLMRQAASAVPEKAGATTEGAHRREARPAPEKLSLRQAFDAHRDAFQGRLQIVLKDDDFAALAESRFSEEVEQQLVLLTAHGLTGKVVADRELLAGVADHALVARAMRDGEPQGESLVADLGLVRDLAQTREDVVRASAGLPPTIGSKLRGAMLHVALAALRPTLELNQAETQRRTDEARARVAPVFIPVKRGEKIISDGERVEKHHLLIFRGIREQTRALDVLSARIGGGVLALFLVLLLWGYAHHGVSGFRPTRKDAVLLAVLYLATLGITTLGLAAGDALHDRFPRLPPESFYYLIPFAAGALMVRSVLSAEIALLFSIAAGASVGLVAGRSIFFALYAILTSVSASGLAAHTSQRRRLFRVGCSVGVLGAFFVLSTGLFTGRASNDLASLRTGGLIELGASALAAFAGNALLLPILVLVGLPLVETVFGYVTDVKLLELANLNHPALKELIVQAPGTYHHSIIMGSLVESAATAINANALLARVSAYYHDIGKIRNPLYFAENQRGENKHEQLAPSMSALIVKRHVTDGLELAAHWRLPRVVSDTIPQHHGTRFVSYFWAKAQNAAESDRAANGNGNGRGPSARDEGPDESLYRYAGPKPQSREAALVMIADACEASARALEEPTAERLRTLVQKRINEIFSEGQLDECELTLKDLNAIAAAMVRALEAVYHSRPEYPGRAQLDRERVAPVLAVKGQG
jgi:putative nucleotidyltransferase with HDIG domain